MSLCFSQPAPTFYKQNRYIYTIACNYMRLPACKAVTSGSAVVTH